MLVVDVVDVVQSAGQQPALLGGCIDYPKPNSRADARSVDIVGWALGRDRPVVGIELTNGHGAFRRVPLGVHRPDLARVFEGVNGAERSGFQLTLSTLGLTDAEVGVHAILKGQTRVMLGTLHLRRKWEGEDELVSIIIPCHNQGHYLPEAIASALEQTHGNIEVIVVDDGSSDNTASVAACYPQVKYVRQPNQGPSAARNTGIRQSSGSYIIFLDADDRLSSQAVEKGLEAHHASGNAGLVYGRFADIDHGGERLGIREGVGIARNHYERLLRGNFIEMQGAVMYRRDAIQQAGAFDISLRGCEDYDLYLRIARQFPIQKHEHVVAEYRRHSGNATRDAGLMLRCAMRVLQKQRRHASGRRRSLALSEGMRFWRRLYGGAVLQDARSHRAAGEWTKFFGAIGGLAVADPRAFLSWLVGRSAPWSADKRLWPQYSLEPAPEVHGIQWGDFRRQTPFSRNFGYERGQPVDRYYIEDFLQSHQADIRGAVLEIAEKTYTDRFGGSRVTHSDVLSLSPQVPATTIVGDITCEPQLRSERYDCAIVTQTLQLVYDVRSALATLHRILRPGGVLLATVPGLTQMDCNETWHWAFTTRSVAALIEEAFPDARVDVKAYGNVLAAAAGLYGVAADELHAHELDEHDARYPVTIAIRAVKPGGTSGASHG